MRDEIYQLESSLLTKEVRKSKEALDKLLSEEFIELSSSGQIYNKQFVLQTLPSSDPIEDIVGEIEQFDIMDVSEDKVLATYRILINGVMSLRSSIWKKNGDQWQMIFHQGTVMK